MLSTQVGIPVYKDRTFTQQIGALSGDFTALEQGPNIARVRGSGLAEPGWVKLPGLSNNRSEVTDFAGGLIRIFRRDWSGAIDLLSRVTKTPSAPVSIRISSYQLMAAASQSLHDQAGTPNRSVEYAEAAEKLNPYLRWTVKYKCMAQRRFAREATYSPRTTPGSRRSKESLKPGRWVCDRPVRIEVFGSDCRSRTHLSLAEDTPAPRAVTPPGQMVERVIAILEQVGQRIVPRKRVAQLPGRPRSRRMSGDRKMPDASPTVREEHQRLSSSRERRWSQPRQTRRPDHSVVSRRFVVREGVRKFAGGPRRGRMVGHGNLHDSPLIKGKNDEHEAPRALDTWRKKIRTRRCRREL